MIPTTHDEKKIAPPRFVNAVERPRSYERLLRAFVPVYQAREKSARELVLGDIGELSSRDVLDRYLELRDTLAYRRLRGEKLTERERLLLGFLNEFSQRLLPRSERLAQDVLDAIEEARRLGARRRSR